MPEEKRAERNPAISVLRVISMMMIVLCHTYRYYTFLPGSNILGLFFNVGVQVFLLISGFLYGSKNVSSFRKFYFGRIEKIALPAIVLSITVIVVRIISGQSILRSTVIAYILNLQGLLFLNWGVFSSWIREIDVLGPLWFCTIIMLCYLCVPVLQKAHTVSLSSWSIRSRKMILIALTSGALLILEITSTDFTYICVFVCGYFIGHPSYYLMNSVNKQLAEKWVLVGAGLQLFRLIIRHFADGTSFYSTYIQVSHFGLALAIFVTFLWFGKKHSRMTYMIAQNKLFLQMEKLSFYIYLTHGIFCFGNITNVYTRIDNLALATGCFIVLTLSSAFSLKVVTDKLLNLIRRKK